MSACVGELRSRVRRTNVRQYDRPLALRASMWSGVSDPFDGAARGTYRPSYLATCPGRDGALSAARAHAA